MFLCISLFVSAQASGNDEKKLQGVWILDDVIIHETNDTTPISRDSVDVEIYPEIEIRKSQLLFSYRGQLVQKGYRIEGNYIYFNFVNTSLYAEWALFEKKLYIEWGEDVASEFGDPKTLVVLLVYKQK